METLRDKIINEMRQEANNTVTVYHLKNKIKKRNGQNYCVNTLYVTLHYMKANREIETLQPGIFKLNEEAFNDNLL